MPLTPAGKVIALRHEGIDQLVYAMEVLQRAEDSFDWTRDRHPD